MMPIGAPYIVYIFTQLGVQDPVAYTVTVNSHQARLDEGASVTGYNPDDPAATSVPITEAVWQEVTQRLQVVESVKWPVVHGQVGGSRVSIQIVGGDAIVPGESAQSLERDKFAAIERVVEPVKELLGDAVPSAAAGEGV